MNIIIATLIIILLYSIFTTWLEGKEKKGFFEKAIEKVSSLIDSKLELMTDLCEAGPLYLVVYTQDSNYPIWISNSIIRSLHPDPKNYKIIIKQYSGDDMVIENVKSYEMCASSDLCDYEF